MGPLTFLPKQIYARDKSRWHSPQPKHELTSSAWQENSQSKAAGDTGKEFMGILVPDGSRRAQAQTQRH